MRQGQASNQEKRVPAGGTAERRAEIGRGRRDRTRQQLLVAAAKLVAWRSVDGLTIENFIKEAGVARGTFYNYFDSREQLIDALWQHVGKASMNEITQAARKSPDPAVRLATGLRLAIRKTASDHVWGWMMFSMIGADSDLDKEMRSFPVDDIHRGIALGRFKMEDPIVAGDNFIGVVSIAMKAVLVAERPADYPEQCAFFVLRGLGLDPAEARDIAHRELPESQL